MKRYVVWIMLSCFVLPGMSQIIIDSDSIVTLKSEVVPEKYVPVMKVKEKFTIEIDKDLLTLHIFTRGYEHAVMEKGFVIDLLSVDPGMQKWLFKGVDMNCKGYTITLDIPKKKFSLISLEQDPKNILTEVYYPVNDIRINEDAIRKHIAEKNQLR